MALDHKTTIKLLNVLNLTTSDNDNEALTAMRTANNILKKHKLDWHKFYNIPKEQPKYQYEPPPKQEPRQEPKKKKSSQVIEMISFIRENAWDGFNFDFIDSLEDSFNKYGSLTNKQFKALAKIFNMMEDRKGE